MIKRNARLLADRNSQVYSAKVTQASQSETSSTNTGMHRTLRDINSNTDLKSHPLIMSPKKRQIKKPLNSEIDEIVTKSSYSVSQSSYSHYRTGKRQIENIDPLRMRNKLNDYYAQKEQSPAKQDSGDKHIIVREYADNSTNQDEAKIIDTEEAEENDLVMHKRRPVNEISSIDLSSGLVDTSEFNSTDQMVHLLPSANHSKKNSFAGKEELSPSFKFEYMNSRDLVRPASPPVQKVSR